MSKTTGLVLDERAYRGDISPPDAFEDKSRYKNDGTHTNITWVQTDYGLWVRSFNGSTSIVNCGSDPSLDNLAGMTLIAWINPTSLGENNNGRIFAKHTGSGVANGWRLQLYDTYGIRFEMDYATQDLISLATNSTFSLALWQQVALTWTGSANATTALHYVNGSAIGLQSSVNGTGGRVSDSASSLSIGSNIDTNRAYNGLISLTKFFNYALSAEQIAAIYQAERHWFGV